MGRPKKTFDDCLEALILSAGDDLELLRRIRDMAALQVRLAEKRKESGQMKLEEKK